MSRPLAKSITTVHRLHDVTPIAGVSMDAVNDGTACQQRANRELSMLSASELRRTAEATSDAGTFAMLSGGAAPPADQAAAAVVTMWKALRMSPWKAL